MKKRWSDMRRVLGLVVLASAISLGLAAEGRCADWAPSKPVEFVVPAGPGGGSDVFARTAAGIVEAEKLSPVPFVVVNRPGGNAIVGMTQVAQRERQSPYPVDLSLRAGRRPPFGGHGNRHLPEFHFPCKHCH